MIVDYNKTQCHTSAAACPLDSTWGGMCGGQSGRPPGRAGGSCGPQVSLPRGVWLSGSTGLIPLCFLLTSGPADTVWLYRANPLFQSVCKAQGNQNCSPNKLNEGGIWWQPELLCQMLLYLRLKILLRSDAHTLHDFLRNNTLWLWNTKFFDICSYKRDRGQIYIELFYWDGWELNWFCFLQNQPVSNSRLAQTSAVPHVHCFLSVCFEFTVEDLPSFAKEESVCLTENVDQKNPLPKKCIMILFVGLWLSVKL